MRDCPKCSQPVDGSTCNACGYSESPTKRKGTTYHEADWWRCAYTDRGIRCDLAGAICTTTNHTTSAGPWYCRNHIDAIRSGYARRIGAGPPPMGFPNLKAALHGNLERMAERAAIQGESTDPLP